jgi:pimeloyl-ACP methyl ester carboxylesterase
MQTHTVTGGGGIRLHVDETGNSAGRSILFLHGFSQCRLAWTKQLTSDLMQEFRLVTLDLRGHGLSEKPRSAYGDSHLWADDLQAVITTLRLQQPVLVGWSYGGVIICDYLRDYGQDGIGGINLVGAVTKLGSDDALALIGSEVLALAQGLFSNDVEESVPALQAFIRLCLAGEPTPADLYLFLGYNAVVPPYVRQGLFARTLHNDDLLPRIERPVLITHGEADRVVHPEAARQHAAAMQHAQVSWYPHVGHAPFWEDAPRFNRELRAFVRSLGG